VRIVLYDNDNDNNDNDDDNNNNNNLLLRLMPKQLIKSQVYMLQYGIRCLGLTDFACCRMITQRSLQHNCKQSVKHSNPET